MNDFIDKVQLVSAIREMLAEMKKIDKLAAIRTVMSVCTFILQLVILFHIMGGNW